MCRRSSGISRIPVRETSISGLIGRFDAYRGKLEAASAGAEVAVSTACGIRPPLPKPGNIVLHGGGKLYGERDTGEAGAHQRFP